MHHSSIFSPGRLFRGDDRTGKIQDVQEGPDDARHQETKGRGESSGGDGRRGGGLFCAEILLMIIIDNHTSDRGIMSLSLKLINTGDGPGPQHHGFGVGSERGPCDCRHQDCPQENAEKKTSKPIKRSQPTPQFF